MEYRNPIIRGLNPDPSICRVGKDYYIVTSSAEYFPGLPVYHSTDLVNWEQIGNCVSNPEWFPMEKASDSGGLWAATIRYDSGKFYVTATLENYGNFIISAEDPGGEWSAPVWLSIGGIDPSLYFENGRAYYCTNEALHPGKEEITLSEIDVRTGEVLQGQQVIWTGIGGGFMEAPHLYKVGDWYYLITAEGGTMFNHMVTAARSRELWGPYESCPSNPILTNVHDTSKRVQCAGHADLIQDHHGNWWFVHLAIRLSRRTMSHLGRETFLTPVIWKDEWPAVKNNRMASLTDDGPLWEEQENKKVWKADFSQTEWEPEWVFLRRPESGNYERGGGKLKLYSSRLTLEEKGSPTFAAIRPIDFECSLETEFCYKPLKDGDRAGVVLRLTSEFYYFIGKQREADGTYLVVEKRAEDFRQTACRIPLKGGKLKLQIRMSREVFGFLYAEGDEELQTAAQASTRFLSCEVAGRCFTGILLGLYAVSAENTGTVMEVSKFGIR